ncbi:putative polyketide synthase 16 [Labeo rohita]|uniref:Putative polyketide synthase 16 n=1 Tax=Labeo rohita TaxID=84645 RepID=A0A498LR90_LABRO|nr:putative polyketide synthase 16 [Labeo rohita]
MDDVEIAVVGIGCHFPGGEGLENFWRVLINGENCAVEIPNDRFNLSQWYDPDESKTGKTYTAKAALIDGLNEFDHKFFGITNAETITMDPQHKLLLQCTYRALEDSGIPMEKASGMRTGVFLGLMNRDFELGSVRINPKHINHTNATGAAMSIAANRISYIFNFTGPSLSIDCACSSSLVALHLACQAIKQGDCDMALCGGVTCILEPTLFVTLSKAKMISSDGTSKPFSSKANGYGRGEGCGVILLKPLKKALEDHDHIWGIISKTAVNQDGHSVSPITKPSMVQQEELLRKIYSTETELTSVQYIEAHGTGTPIGDPIEAESQSYFRCRILPIIILNSKDKNQLSDIPVLPRPRLFKANSVYIVTGGLTGLGFETVKFIAQKGGGNIVILSRSNPTPQMQQEISELSSRYGSVIKSLPCDVSVSEQVDQTIGSIGKLFPSSPIKGVFHSAVVLHDGLIERLDKTLYEKVMRPKVNGVLNLHRATIHCNLDYFVCYSSIAAFIGNASQTNYAAANTFLDTFCQYRRNIGLSGQSINWGALNLGLLLNKVHVQKFLEARGIMLLEIPEIHESLEQCLLINKPQQVVCKFNFKNNWNNILSQNKALNVRMFKIAQEAISKAGVNMSKPEKPMTSSSPRDCLRFMIGETTGVEMDELNDDVHLFDLGIDSMLAMTLQNLIFSDRGVNVPLVTLLDPNSTLSTLIKILEESCVDKYESENEIKSTYL